MTDASHAIPHVEPTTTALFGLILAMMIGALAAEEKLHAKKSVIVGVFAVVSLILGSAMGFMPFGNILVPSGHELDMPVYIPAIDWKVIAIIVGSSVFVDVTSKSGLFTWIAIKLTKASKGDPVMLLWFYGLMTVIFSAVLNNVTAMIIVGSLTVVSLNKLGGNLTPIGSASTLVCVTIMHKHKVPLSFAGFVVKAVPFAIVQILLAVGYVLIT